MAKKHKPVATWDAPGYLSTEAQGIWGRIHDEYELTDTARLILQTALEAFDRMRRAQKEIEDNGGAVTMTDRFGQLKPHPACSVERDSRTDWLKAMGQLNLDLEPLHDGPGRPAGS